MKLDLKISAKWWLLGLGINLVKHGVIMGFISSQITSLTIVYSIVYSDADQRKHQSSASLALVQGIHRFGEFPVQMASNAENVSIWWRHHGISSAVAAFPVAFLCQQAKYSTVQFASICLPIGPRSHITSRMKLVWYLLFFALHRTVPI